MRNSSADYDFRQSGAPSLLRLSYARFSLVGIGRAKAAALRSIRPAGPVSQPQDPSIAPRARAASHSFIEKGSWLPDNANLSAPRRARGSPAAPRRSAHRLHTVPFAHLARFLPPPPAVIEATSHSLHQQPWAKKRCTSTSSSSAT